MAVNPHDIVERQLALLLEQSNKGFLTFEECQSLERLVKLQLVLRLKGNSKALADPFTEISSEDLQKLLPLLSD